MGRLPILAGRLVLGVLLLVLAALGPAAGQTDAQPAPYNLFEYRGQTGELRFLVTGSMSGTVYGNGVYTDDSGVAAAAVHAGVVAPGQTAVVTVEMLGPQQSFEGAVSNGITSFNYGPWDGSFRFVGAGIPVGDVQPPPPPLDAVLPDPGNLTQFAANTGALLSFEVTGADYGPVYGDGVYTTDSSLARAAVHAGVVERGGTAVVTVEILGPQASFTASERNGVSTYAWGQYGSAYRFVVETAVENAGPGPGPGPKPDSGPGPSRR